MNKHANAFLDFVREQGVVGLAVGFILGGAVTKLVASLVGDIIQPIIGMVFGSTEGLAALHYESIMWGNFLAILIDFIVVAMVVYFGVKVFGLDKLDKKKT